MKTFSDSKNSEVFIHITLYKIDSEKILYSSRNRDNILLYVHLFINNRTVPDNSSDVVAVALSFALDMCKRLQDKVSRELGLSCSSFAP